MTILLDRRTVLAAACLALASCGSITGAERGIGTILTDDQAGGLGTLVVPDTVAAGVSFTARVTTFGSSSCTQPDGATVRVAGAVAEITPYDRRATGGVCTADIHPFPRDVQLRFASPGPAVVRVRGSHSAMVERTVIVR